MCFLWVSEQTAIMSLYSVYGDGVFTARYGLNVEMYFRLMLVFKRLIDLMHIIPRHNLPSFFCAVLSADVNLLKPTGHVMHQQFNIQQLYALPTLYLCVLYLSENKQRLVPLTA